jgi:hypothetical protein
MEGLSAPHTKAGRLQRACLDLLNEHKADGALPTSLRFLFYELLDRGVIPKSYGATARRTPSQDISVAAMALRENRLVPWSSIVDETRSLTAWRYNASVYEYVSETVDRARIDPWDGEPPPLILCESRSLSGVLTSVAGTYLAPVASTNGQTGGFLHTALGPAVEGGRRVLYLGDLDYAGGHIEENTRRVLEEYGELEWERIAITDVQVRERGLPVVSKPDRRFKPPRSFDAVETEALGQREIQRLLTERLDEMLPEPLANVREREERQRVQVRELLEDPMQ